MSDENPFVYNEEIAEEVCQRLAEGETLFAICQDIRLNDPLRPDIQPHKIRRWSRDIETFGARYRQALADGADALVEQTHHIAENPTPSEIITEKWSGGRNPKLLERTVRIVDGLERDKLRILVRQYRARVQSPVIQNIERRSTAIVGDGNSPAVAVQIVGGLPSSTSALPGPRPDQAADTVPVSTTENPPT